MSGNYGGNWNVMQQEGPHSLLLGDEAVLDFQTALNGGTNWWGIGFLGENDGEMPDGSIGGFNDFNPPYIVVQYETGEPGDLNQDGEMNILDIMMIVGIILHNSDPTNYQLWAGDLNQDGEVNIMDILQIINCLIIGC